MQYPLKFSFKKIALTNKVTVEDLNGVTYYFAQQKMFKFKEKIQIYSDENKTSQVAEINADRVIDFSPVFTITNSDSKVIAQVSRRGKKSIWNANYEILDDQGNAVYNVSEDSPWVKVLNTVLTEIPFLGLISGYFFNPTYSIRNNNGEVVATIKKEKSFFEASYILDATNFSELNQAFPLSSLVVILRERFRG